MIVCPPGGSSSGGRGQTRAEARKKAREGGGEEAPHQVLGNRKVAGISLSTVRAKPYAVSSLVAEFAIVRLHRLHSRSDDASRNERGGLHR